MKVADLATGVALGGRFRLVRLLGRGSYGDVWLADSLADPGLPPKVAVKVYFDNVLLPPGGGARLLDFGQTRPIEDRFVETDGTGALPYMAPEILGTAVDGQGRRYVASDIYACGVIAYRFLTGRFPRRTLAEVMNLTPFPRPMEINPSVPAPLDALVMRCLEKRPERRYATGAELLAAVQRLQARLLEQTLPVTAPARPPALAVSLAADLERLARDLIAQGRGEEAVDRLEEALRRMSTTPNLLFIYAAAARAVNKLDVAHLVYQRIIQWLRAQGAEPVALQGAMEGRSELDVRLKHYEEAADGYAWLAAQWPEKRWYRFRAGVTLGLAGRYPEAAKVLQALHESAPPSAVVCAKLGFAHRQLGVLDLAIQYFNEALMLDEHDPVALSQMAEIRAIQGRMDKAEEYLGRLEQVDGAEEEVRRLRRQLGR